MAKKIRKLVPASIREALGMVHECAEAAREQVGVKEEMLEQCLLAMQQLMAENGCGDVEMSFTESTMEFLFSSLEDYMDGEPFAAFVGEGDDDETFVMLCRVYQDPEDEGEDDDEETFSMDTQVIRETGGLTYVLTEDGWELADLMPEED